MFNFGLLLPILFAFEGAESSLRVSNVFGDHMVLQEPNPSKGINPTRIFGEACMNETVYIMGSSGFPGPFRISPTTNNSKSHWGNFSVEIIPNTDDASYPGPYSIEIYTFSNSDNTTITGQFYMSDVYFGDVFLCSGQSNMELAVGSTDNKEYEYKAANELPNIRLFHTPDTYSNFTLQNISENTQWQVADNVTIKDFSAVCWMHGRMLAQYFAESESESQSQSQNNGKHEKHEKNGKNGKNFKKSENSKNMKKLQNKKKKYIGLIQSTIGGTSIYFWAPGHIGVGCNSTGLLPNTGECATKTKPYYNFPGSIYNAMINPIAMNGKGLSISGALWYQGEADSGENDLFTYDAYVCMLTGLINGWRQAFNNNKLMFIIIQLPNTVMSPYGEPNIETGWPAIQAAQYAVWQMLAGQDISMNNNNNDSNSKYQVNTGIVTISDQGQNSLHYPHKIVVSQRAFYWTKWILYNNISGVNPFPPYVKYAKYVSNSETQDNLQFYIKIGNANTNPFNDNGLTLKKAQNCSILGDTIFYTNVENSVECCENGGVSTIIMKIEGLLEIYKGHKETGLWGWIPANVTFINDDENSNDGFIIVNPIWPQPGIKNWPNSDETYLGTDKRAISKFFIQTNNKCSIVNDYGIPLAFSGPFIITPDIENNFETLFNYHGSIKFEL